jgi:branched-chain amino acid transport system ATP-binding protein
MINNVASQAEATSIPVLEAQGLTTGYGGQPVVHDVNLFVRPGEIVALLGPNGAGKTTTLLALSGELRPMQGQVILDGLPVKSPLHMRARRGLAYVTEERSVFMGMSARDNLRVGKGDATAALALFPELERLLSVRAGLLSGGEQQMLTVGRALSRNPRLLLADELSLGLAPLIVTRLLEAVRDAAREQGTAVLLVEQHVRKVLEFADRVYVMSRGRIRLEGSAQDLRDRIPEIEHAYLARDATG